MIRPPGFPGVAFTTAAEGDVRGSTAHRAAVSKQLGISSDWAVADQVHGRRVARVFIPGTCGPRDGLLTTAVGTPLAIFTADCYGVAVVADEAVGVAHAGWRGVASGVVPQLVEEMTRIGHPPLRAAIGPGIGACCFEVGPEVEASFPDHRSETSWGTRSVDLAGAIRAQLGDIDVWTFDGCTRCDVGFHSHRADSTEERMAAIAWID